MLVIHSNVTNDSLKCGSIVVGLYNPVDKYRTIEGLATSGELRILLLGPLDVPRTSLGSDGMFLVHLW